MRPTFVRLLLGAPLTYRSDSFWSDDHAPGATEGGAATSSATPSANAWWESSGWVKAGIPVENATTSIIVGASLGRPSPRLQLLLKWQLLAAWGERLPTLEGP
eukprot:scaffold11452_cov27-Phaeocystis_antarctica.AAC.2